MACTVTVNTSTELPSGKRMISADVAIGDVYLTGGSVIDLSDYFSGSPDVITSALDTTGVYVASHNGGTAAAGKLITMVAANGTQVANAFNLAAVVTTIVAVGDLA